MKLYVLEITGFDRNNIRWLAEKVFSNGKKHTNGHAVTLVRIKGQDWFLNSQQLIIIGKTISRSNAKRCVDYTSTLEPAATHFNFSKRSFIHNERRVYVPDFSFNSTHAFCFLEKAPRTDQSNVPKETREAKTKVTRLTNADWRQYKLSWVINSAFSSHYRIVDDQKTEAVPTMEGQSTSPQTLNKTAITSRPASTTAASGNIVLDF